MRFRRLWPLGLISLALASTGCDSGRKNPPDTLVRVLNATANYPPLAFWRGAVRSNPVSAPLQVDFRGGNQATWDEDTYNFHVTYSDQQTQSFVEVENFSKQIVNGTWYTFVLYQKAGAVTHKVLESTPVAPAATDAQIQAIHAVEGGPSVDIYLVAPGTAVAGVPAWGSLAFEGTLAPHGFAPGDYQFVATEQGNPAHVLYASAQFTLSAGIALTFALTPDSGEGIQPFSVTVLNDTASVLVDPALQAEVRVINGATDRQPRDVAFDNNFTPPLFPGVVFATPTPYQRLATGTDVPLSVTPAGNPGVLEFSGVFTPAPGASYTLLVVGPAGALITNIPQDDRRRVKSQSKLTFYDAAASCTTCDVILLPAGTDPNTAPALNQGIDPYPEASLGSVIPVTHWAGDYDVVVRIAGTQTVVSGPKRITLKDAGLHGIVLTDNPDGTTIDMTLIDDFQ
jgi:hypothetical protein